MKRSILTFTIIFLSLYGFTQNKNKSDIELITETIMHYIEGNANGEPERLEIAFHPEFNLYSVTKDDSLRIWSGKDYIGRKKKGQKTNQIGRIVSIDFDKDAAVAKVKITIPNKVVFTDYFLLVKYEGSWKIMHKAFTIKKHSQPQVN